VGFLDLFRRSESQALVNPRIPEGVRIYAIGDIHGRADLLDEMAQLIAADYFASPAVDPITVFLGDYVDRGPDSCGVLERLSSGTVPTRFVALRGNHEHMLLQALLSPDAMEQWYRSGGLETLHSYGVRSRSYGVRSREPRSPEAYDELAHAFAQRIPDHHVTFLHETGLCYEVGDYFFCHAGVRPGVELEQQVAADLLWIRDEFLPSKRNFGRVVVHGHSPVLEPELRGNRINIDTGAYVTGRLTCLVLEAATSRFLMTGRQAQSR